MNRGTGKPLVEAQMISLADIAFLTIFFLVMTSTFMKDKTKIDLPQLPKTAEGKSAIVVAMDGGGRITLNGEKVGNASLLEGQLKGTLANRDPNDPAANEIIFRCDKKARYKDYAPVYTAISDAGGTISVIHQPRR